MSIKPKYADKIFSGEKKWEYRKKIPNIIANHDTIVVYASSPVKKVIGEFSVQYILSYPVNMIWYQTGQWGGVTAEEFLDYFKCAEIAHAIKIKERVLYMKPRPLSDYGITRPPQNFMYLDDVLTTPTEERG
jgi:predicted transcriptional regulator